MTCIHFINQTINFDNFSKTENICHNRNIFWSRVFPGQKMKLIAYLTP